MRIDVVFGPAAITPGVVTGRVVAVIDVLRASTTIAAALSNGARAVIPFDSADGVIMRAKQFERADVRTAGEQKMLPIPGFDLGNSPREMTRDAVDGKTLLLTTTNGTAALVNVQGGGGGARDVVVAGYVNLSAVSALLRTAARGGTDITIICAGRDRQFSLDDAACAGRYTNEITRHLSDPEISDGAFACALIDRNYGGRIDQIFADSEHGKSLVAAGFADDLRTCATIDAFPVVPIYQDRQITVLGPDRER